MAYDVVDNRLGEHLKINLNGSLQAMATGRAQDQVFMQGRHYPCTVAQVISPGIVKINFEVNAKPFNLPQVTVPVVGSEYMRQPIKVGDKGMCIAADARLGGISGLGTGTPDLTAPGNLSGLAFLWLGNTHWPTTNDLGLPIDPTAVSFYSSLSCVTSIASGGVTLGGSRANLSITGPQATFNVTGFSFLNGGSSTLTVPTGDSSTNVATTAFVHAAISASGGGGGGSGYLPLTGGTLTGNLQIATGGNCMMYLNKPNANAWNIIYGQTNGATRWSLVLGSAEAESGGNAGSNFFLDASNDAGTAVIGHAIIINRASLATTLGGALTTAGGVTVDGTLAGADAGFALSLNPPAGAGAYVKLNAPVNQVDGIAGFKGGNWRWLLQPGDGATENGSNSGSNFSLGRYTDTGAYIDTPLTIARNTGIAAFLYSPTAPTPAVGDSSNSLATTAFVGAAISSMPTGGVSSFNGRTGAVTLTTTDITNAGGATSAQLNNYLLLTGGAISGNLSVAGSMTAPTRTAGDSTTNVATTAFVEAAIAAIPPGGGGGGSTITISDTAPASPLAGNLWFDSVGLQTYIWYDDPTSSQWTPVTNQSGLLTDAPSNGTLYGRQNGIWTSVTAALGNYLPLTGGTLTGALNISPSSGAAPLNLHVAASGSANQLTGSVGSNYRWSINLGDGAAETGSDTGSNFLLARFHDNGSFIDDPLSINRATGNATFSGTVTSNYGTFLANGAVGNVRGVEMLTNGSQRWQITATGDAESGSNAGSNLGIYCFNDSGAYLSNPLFINRATGSATFNGGQIQVTVPGTANGVPFISYQSALPAGGTMYIATGGTAWGNYNNASLTFYNAGTNSQSNSVAIGVLGGNGMSINGYGNAWIPNQLQIGGGGYLYLGNGGGAKLQFDGSVGTDGSGSTLKIDIYGSGTGTYGIGLSGSNQYYLSGGTHNFWTAGTKTLSIASNGNATHTGWLYAGKPPAGANYVPITNWSSGTYQSPEVIAMNWGGTNAYFWYNNWGNQAYWSTAGSDRRRKSNIRSAGDALDIVQRLKVYDLDFTPKAGPDHEHVAEHWPFSLIADEVAAVMPHAAMSARDMDERGKEVGDPNWVALHPLHLCSTLWRAVQQLTEQNKELLARVSALEEAHGV